MVSARPLTLVGAALVVSILGCGSGEGAAPPPGAMPTAVKVVTVGTEPLERSTRTFGTIEAVRSAELKPEASGTVGRVEVTDGAEVKRGQLLLKLRDDGARAQLAEAEARFKLAEAKHGRVAALFERQNTSRQELDQAVAERDLAAAGVASAQDAVRRTEVRAPFDGTVGRVEVSVGASVGPATTVTRIEDLTEVTVDLGVPERLVPNVAVGSTVRVEVDAWAGEVFVGEVRYVAPRIDAATRTFEVRAHVANADRRLRPGLSAEVELVTASRQDAVMVPTQAVLATDRGTTVFVVDPEGKAQARPVKTGTRTDERVEVVEGLAAGDRVVVEGLVRLAPGAAVRVVE